jgi:hypothetical protein
MAAVSGVTGAKIMPSGWAGAAPRRRAVAVESAAADPGDGGLPVPFNRRPGAVERVTVMLGTAISAATARPITQSSTVAKVSTVAQLSTVTQLSALASACPGVLVLVRVTSFGVDNARVP